MQCRVSDRPSRLRTVIARQAAHRVLAPEMSAEISRVRVAVVKAGMPEAKRWARYVKEYHYLGLHVGG